ncbi:MAG: DUF2314 domain-containing protein [Treponema sp.]|jgi:uncharacterized protein YegJ (DUF2314 family)|nr:DUF2314 domain-containing protein [Treponema sp.]
MKIRRFGILVPLLLLSCGKIPGRFVFPPAGTSGEGAAGTVHRAVNDGELEAIAVRARDTLPFFFSHLDRPALGEKNFRVKCPFRTDDGSGFVREQLWFGDIRLENGRCSGEALNAPFYVSGVSLGDRANLDTGDITDWMFTRKGKIVGGLSIKHLLEQIPPGERDDEERAVLAMFE